MSLLQSPWSPPLPPLHRGASPGTMRSRFLTADYFAPSPSAAASSDLAIELASLPFPSLPVPTLPPDPHLLNPFPFSADFLPDPSVAGDDLDSLPFDSALTEFLAAVVPQPLPVPDIPAAAEGLLDDYLYGRGVYRNGFSSMDPVAFRIPKASEGLDDSHTKGDKEEGLSLEASEVTKRGGLLEAMFEVPEVDFLLVLQKKIASLDDEEPDACVNYSFGVPDVKIHPDFIDIDTETRIPYPAELAESIYQVEVPVKHDDDMNCPYAKDSSCMEIAGLENGQIIPQLEASMISWEFDECPAKTAVSNIFHNIVEHLYDGAQVRLPSFGSTEFLRSCDMDIFALVCKDAPRVEYQADKPITAKDVAEMDFVRINHDILLDKKSALYPLKPDGTCSDFPCSILLEEVETINFPSEDAFKTLVQSVKAEMNTSEEIFKDDFDQAKSFYESVVSSEWALVDDTFKSLPTPILPDDKATRSMLPPIQVLCSLKPLPLSAADGIYLDWHLLSEGPCNQESCSTYASMVEEVKPCSLSPELQISCQQMPALDISFLEDFPRSAKLQHEDKKNEIYVPGPIPHDPSANLETTQKNMLESDVRGHSHMDKLSPEKESSLFKPTSQSNGLSFYLNVRNDTNKVRKNEDISTLDIPSSKQAAPFSTRPRVNKLIEIHPVNLSDLIQGLIKDIHVSYTSALQESAYFRHSFSDGQGLSISKQKLLELITGEGSEGLYSYCKYEDKMELIVLYALKQVAYYLCFFGLHAAYLYVGNLTGTFENIPERLRNLQCCIGEARLKAEKQLLESHPSLSVIETILRSNTQIGRKILIVSDRAFWLPLGQKLTAMKITSVEFETYHSTTYSDPVIKTNSKTCMLEELWKSDCILLDNKNIPASFPFSEFCMILEYGGPNKSSILLSLAPKLDGLPPLHFLYVTVDGEGLPNALVEDNHTDQDLKSTLDDVLHTLQKDLQEKMNKMRIVDSLNFIPATNQQQHLQTNHLTVDSSKKIPADVQLHNQGNLNVVDPHNFVTAAEQLNMLNQITIANSQNFVPAVEKSSSTSSVSANVIKAPQDNQSAGVLPLSEKMDSTKAGIPGPEAVIVVNTGNHGKNMLFSRRSSYQQILALERGGMQVVERDVDLPVDLILTTAVCLLWYDTRTSGSSELTISSDTSGITNFVEDIATNILMALSFCFCGCIMVFEGENHLLSAVLEASDSLYASAASLDMNLQLFFSQTPKSTDQIILNCIQNAVRINQAPCPQIPESESLVESFVTAFPSVSPLSAHMILSSGTLLDFLRWSHEQRTQAVEKYRLPPQSISLFSALCKFGELGESKSVMTECSSVDSDISSALLQSARKKKRCATQDFSAAVSHPARPNPCTQLHGDCVENDKVFSPPKLRKFSHIDDMMPDLPEVFMIDQRLNMGSEGVSCQPKKYDVDAVTGIHIIDDYFINELTPNFKTYNERASSMVDTCNFSRQSKLRAKQPIRSSFRASMPSACITSSHPAFPSALEISNDPGNWDVSCGINQSWTDNVHGDFATSSGRNDLGSRYHEPRQEIMQTPASSLPFLKQDFGCHGASQGSGWEMDYLRQMNENRKARQEQSRCNVSATWSNSRTRDGSSRILSVPPIESFRYQRNTDTPFRDQSPSDIESFRHRRNINTLLRDQSPSNEAHRYEKGRGGTKAQSHRVRKDFKAQPSINHGKSIVPSIEPTWTPLDKRARQKLTFATHGSEKQTKLVWRHKSSPGVGCGFPKRYQEEAP